MLADERPRRRLPRPPGAVQPRLAPVLPLLLLLGAAGADGLAVHDAVGRAAGRDWRLPESSLEDVRPTKPALRAQPRGQAQAPAGDSLRSLWDGLLQRQAPPAGPAPAGLAKIAEHGKEAQRRLHESHDEQQLVFVKQCQKAFKVEVRELLPDIVVEERCKKVGGSKSQCDTMVANLWKAYDNGTLAQWCRETYDWFGIRTNPRCLRHCDASYCRPRCEFYERYRSLQMQHAALQAEVEHLRDKEKKVEAKTVDVSHKATHEVERFNASHCAPLEQKVAAAGEALARNQSALEETGRAAAQARQARDLAAEALKKWDKEPPKGTPPGTGEMDAQVQSGKAEVDNLKAEIEKFNKTEVHSKHEAFKVFEPQLAQLAQRMEKANATLSDAKKEVESAEEDLKNAILESSFDTSAYAKIRIREDKQRVQSSKEVLVEEQKKWDAEKAAVDLEQKKANEARAAYDDSLAKLQGMVRALAASAEKYEALVNQTKQAQAAHLEAEKGRLKGERGRLEAEYNRTEEVYRAAARLETQEGAKVNASRSELEGLKKPLAECLQKVQKLQNATQGTVVEVKAVKEATKIDLQSHEAALQELTKMLLGMQDKIQPLLKAEGVAA